MPKRPERPNYGELDVGVVKQLAISDKECKKTQEGFQLARTRLAVLEAEEARLAVQLRKVRPPPPLTAPPSNETLLESNTRKGYRIVNV